MQPNKKRAVKKAARIGASGVRGVILLILKVIGTILLTVITTGAIFACIFVIYIKTNLVGSAELDVSLEEFSVNLTSVIYYRDNSTGEYKELCALQGEQNRIWVDYEDIPLDLQHAVVSIEDKRFYTHHGVDWYRTCGAFVNMFLGMKDTFGGSTITQQLLKNITGENEGTVQRKLTEIFRALELEKQYDKKDIMEWYLNIVYFGHKCYGIGAASDYYFGKEVSDLSLAEMCAIVGITNNPSIYSPYQSLENNKERQESILNQMYEQGYISREECESAKAEKLNFREYNSQNSGTTEVYSYFVDAVIEDVIDCFVENRGVSRDMATTLLLNGGYQIYSTIDVDIQEKVDQIYEDLEQIPTVSGSDQQFQSAIVITDPYTGNIVALSGGVGEKTGSRIQNRATQTKRPPGSSFKPISVYAPAMDLGIITPDTRYEDEADIELKGTTWFPHNDNNKNSGVVTIREAVRRSLNTIAAQVLDDLTPSVSFNFLKTKLHITSLTDADCDYAPLALGQLTNGITVREMAAAYGIFVNDGIYTEARTFTEIYDSDGNLIYENEAEQTPAISETTAYWMTSILQDAATSGTGSEANLGFIPTAGKTGTTSSNCDRWFVGYTPYYVAAVWTGYDYPAKIKASGNPAAQIWKKVMTIVHEDLESRKFSTPADIYQTPVMGVDEAVKYYIRGIATDATGAITVLYEEEAGERAAGREVTCTAKDVSGYTLVSESTVKLTLTNDPEDNVVEYMYVSNTPPPVVDPDPSGGETGGGTGGETSGETGGGTGGETSGETGGEQGGETGGETGGEQGGEEPDAPDGEDQPNE